MSESNEAKHPETAAVVKTAMLLPRLAEKAGLDPAKYYAAVKATCGCEGATDEHFAVLLMSADRYSLNPMMKQLYLVKTQRGPTVVIPVDGWVPLLVNHHDYLTHDVSLEWEGEAFKSNCLAATCSIRTRSREALGMGPFVHSEIMSECARDTGPWKSHPCRMIGHKAIIQAARWCFGIYIMDEDEARGIGEVRPTKSTGYVLPTSESVSASASASANVEQSPADTETIYAWRIMIGCQKTLDECNKLLLEFTEASASMTDVETNAILKLFKEHREKLEVIPY